MNHLKFKFIIHFMSLVSLMPLSWHQAIGRVAGRLYFALNKKRRAIAQCNIEHCFPELTRREQGELLQKNAQETGMWFCETPFAWFAKPARAMNKVTIKNPEKLQQAFDRQQGVVVVMPHFGNWEMMNYYLPQHYPSGCMYKEAASATLEKIITDSRERVGTKMFKVDLTGVRQALKHLKQGNLLVILSDHLPEKNAGVYAPFFGQQALTGKMTHTFARHNKATALVVSATRKTKGAGFEIEFHDVENMDSKDPLAAATGLNKAIEKVIRRAPAQYQWIYKRFGRQPEGELTIYQRHKKHS
jgi:KDO2-lipid IV(A) lauroyltransferase